MNAENLQIRAVKQVFSSSVNGRMLRFESVKKYYGPNLIIDIPSLSLDQGVYWVKGGNGAGKSTILKIIAGMIPFDGTIEFDGVNLRTSPQDYRRLVAYTEAEPLYPPFLSGSDLIQFYQKTRNATDEQTQHLKKLFGVDAFEKNAIHTYSSGMVKRLALMLVFLGTPKLILLDEPLVTIDTDTVPILYSLISEGVKQGVCFFLASHQALDAAQLPPFKEIGIRDHQFHLL